MTTLELYQQRGVVVTENIWPAKPKIVAVWPDGGKLTYSSPMFLEPLITDELWALEPIHSCPLKAVAPIISLPTILYSLLDHSTRIQTCCSSSHLRKENSTKPPPYSSYSTSYCPFCNTSW